MRSLLSMVTVGILATIIAATVILFLAINEPNRMTRFDEKYAGRSVENGALIFVNNCATCHGPDGKGSVRAPGLNSAHFFSKRLSELGFSGTITDYVRLTVAGGRPAKSSAQWPQTMPTWGQRFGGPLRDDQIEDVSHFVLNWAPTATDEGAVIPPPPGQASAEPTAAPGGGGGGAGGTVGTDLDNPPLPTGDATSGQALFNGQYGCGGCHSIQPDVRVVGPSMFGVADRAATRKSGMDADKYLRESIVQPGAFIVEGFTDDMPHTFGSQMTPQQLADVIAYLKSLK